MPVQCGWSNQERLGIRLDFVGIWTWEEYYAFDAKCHERIKEIEGQVGLILNFRDSKAMPRNGFEEVRKIARTKNDKIGKIFIVGINPSLAAIGQVMMLIFPESAKRIQICQSIKAADDSLRDWHSSQMSYHLSHKR